MAQGMHLHGSQAKATHNALTERVCPSLSVCAHALGWMLIVKRAAGITPSKPALTIAVKAPAPAPSAKAPMKLKGGLAMAPAPVPAASEKVKTAGGLSGTAPVPGPAGEPLTL